MSCELHLIFLLPFRTNFQHFLRRPDHKQDFVSQWQADFNALPDDLWDDEEMKSELHQRVNVRKSATCCMRVSTHANIVLQNPNSFPSSSMRCEGEKGNGLNTYLPTFKSNGSSKLEFRMKAWWTTLPERGVKSSKTRPFLASVL